MRIRRAQSYSQRRSRAEGAGWKGERRVRYVGVTHYTASAHAEVGRVIAARPVDFVQINYSAAEREAETRVHLEDDMRAAGGRLPDEALRARIAAAVEDAWSG